MCILHPDFLNDNNIFYNCSKISKTSNWHGCIIVNYATYSFSLHHFSTHWHVCVCLWNFPSYTSNYHHNQNTELFQNHKENLLRSPLIFPLHTPVLLLPLATTNLHTISIVLSFSKCYTIIQIDFFSKHNVIEFHQVCCMNY